MQTGEEQRKIREQNENKMRRCDEEELKRKDRRAEQSLSDGRAYHVTCSSSKDRRFAQKQFKGQ